MKSWTFLTAALALYFSGLLCGAPASGQRAVDTEKSTLTVRVYKAGLFSAMGHNHEIAAPISRGTVDPGAHQVELQVKAGALQVRDTDASAKDRAEIQSTMLGPAVLDAQNQPEITFRSTGAQSTGTGAWKVSGNLTIRGQSRPVEVDVQENGAHYVGTARLKQSEFGIKPIKIAGGAVSVKDEIRIEFDIQLAPPDKQ